MPLYSFKKDMDKMREEMCKPFDGIPSGIRVLDNEIMGFGKGELCIIAGRPGLGKSSLARDIILHELYDQIRDKFVEIYKNLHGADEKSFSAKIKPTAAGLDIEVDFYNRGVHPPLALHSEGHQDSMGFCLYLALSEYLNKGVIDLNLLDDIMMSIDVEHRRKFSRLLKSDFPKSQFFITTHDKNWAHQLKSEGVVHSRNMIELYQWNIDTGPKINYSVEIWERIRNDLEKNDIPAAAGKLRRGSEEFFNEVCEVLKAKTCHKIHGDWELGELLPAAMQRYKEIIKKAKVAAQSWEDKDLFERVREVENTIGSIFAQVQVEQWAINKNIHYNNWTNFEMKDFEPVVNTFEDLFNIFICSKCNAIYHLSVKGPKPESLKCNCGNINWNLIPNPSKKGVVK